MNDTQSGAELATEAEVKWIDDGHQVTVTLEYGQFAFAVICPSDGADLSGRPWNELPACRRATDEDGNPQPEKSPTAECYLERLGKEFVSDEFFDGGAPVFEVVSPFAVEYRFEGWDNEAVYVWPKVAVPAPVPQYVWIYVDGENEEMSPVDYATREVAQAHAEKAWRGSVDAEYVNEKLAWQRAVYDREGPDEDGTDFEMLDSDGVRTAWEVRRVTVVYEMPAEPDTEAAAQSPTQGVLPVVPVRGFRVGDLVRITGRDDEVRHADAGQDAPAEAAGSAQDAPHDHARPPVDAPATGEPPEGVASPQRGSGGLRTPEQWCRVYGLHVLDPDGWRTQGAPAWGEPIGLAEFQRRASISTVNGANGAWGRMCDDLAALRESEQQPEPTP
jgi:hypothetical protein